MSKFYRCKIIPVLLTCLLLAGISVQPARSATEWVFDVNSTVDAYDNIINSICSVGAASGGPCTLRAAIAEANAIADTIDVRINIPAGTYDLTIPPGSLFNDIQSGDLDLPQANPGYTIKLIGTGSQPAVIDANQLDRVFEINSGVTVYMENVVIRGGLLSWTGTTGFSDGAGILNEGDLTLYRVVIEENEARCGQETCNFYIAGGGIMNLGRVYMVDSSIRNNLSEDASAIFTTGETGYFFMRNSTISGNHSTQAFTIINWAYLHIRNSTISGNTAGPTFHVGMSNNKTLVLESSTIANDGSLSSIYNSDTGSVTIRDSILRTATYMGSSNCYDRGTWTSEGYNIFSDDSCPRTGPGDLESTDPLLGVMGNWGGPTMTMPLLPGSPAKDHRTGNCTTIPESPASPPFPLLEDQRYYGRTDGMCDTGAFEGVIDIKTVFLPILFR